ncbi:gamma-glutamyltransferase [Rhodospirillum rubrum]|uniref:gamma-glutamyltransferase family protein n=1 Tax=Rhodospirillum rubrum TaxID=1085 RepID=UPI0019066B59|nr:gamma-glutamyltransferase family protein [Rhodospirillum rubrum]MBK1662961.1 gamma-glutamyltransferase [Rhodospirillum rubrum]MBK1675248.1 gamma-glutamyltransferase [Rhodospirillum rubrum]
MRDFFRVGRDPVLAREAMIATSHPLSTAAGLEILTAGGTAVDAALAAVAVQSVVDPLMTGIGGDCFALYAPAKGDVVALNGSGRAPLAASVSRLKALGVGEITQTSPHAITVPGAVSAWIKLHGDYGRLPLATLFARAIAYAEGGYPVTPRVAHDWAREAALVAGDPGAAAVFLPDGRAPLAGAFHAQPKLGGQLRAIARDGAAAFYLGPTAKALVTYLQGLGGLHTLDDFACGLEGAEYVTPISTIYRGHEVFECPPNGQGLAALMILNILSGFDLSEDLALADRLHLQAEATKLAYYHRDALIADPAHLPYPPEALLAPEVAETLRRRIRMDRVLAPALWSEPEHKDTVYLCVVDGQGNAVSLINSIFHGFGSTHLDPATGILLHSRGASFRVIEGHPNAIGPRKRPMHTIIPGMVRKDGKTVMPFGVMGGQYQAAGHAAFLSGVLDRGLDVQQAIDVPRAFSFGGTLEVEPTVEAGVLAALAARGHRVTTATNPIGGAQAIWIDPQSGLLAGGSDQRKDGCALGV